MNEVEMQNDIKKLREDLDNRDREFGVLKAVIDYLSKRDDEKDPSPEFKKQEEYGFISDVIALLCQLHPLLVRWLPDGDEMKYVLSNTISLQ